MNKNKMTSRPLALGKKRTQTTLFPLTPDPSVNIADLRLALIKAFQALADVPDEREEYKESLLHVVQYYGLEGITVDDLEVAFPDGELFQEVWDELSDNGKLEESLKIFASS